MQNAFQTALGIGAEAGQRRAGAQEAKAKVATAWSTALHGSARVPPTQGGAKDLAERAVGFGDEDAEAPGELPREEDVEVALAARQAVPVLAEASKLEAQLAEAAHDGIDSTGHKWAGEADPKMAAEHA